jgi:hypothetical protein
MGAGGAEAVPFNRSNDVLGSSVRAEGTDVGRVSAVVADTGLVRVLGLEVTRPDNSRVFLPWAAASARNGTVDAASRFVLFDADDVYEFVRSGARLIRDADQLARLFAGHR